MSTSALSPRPSVYELPADTTDVATAPVNLARELIRICESGQDGLGIEPWRYAEDAINRISGEANGRITREYSAARKNTVLAMVSEMVTIRENEQNPDKPQTVNIVKNLDDMFLSGSPNLLDYMGSLEDDFDVLTALAAVPELREAYAIKCHGLAYDLTFCDMGVLDDLTAGLLVNKSSAAQLSALRMLGDVTYVMQYTAGYDAAVVGAEKIKKLLYGHAVFGSTFQAWLPHVAALSLIDRMDGENAGERAVHVLARAVCAREREFAQGRKFGGDWAKHRVVQLAPGIMGARSEGGMIEGAAYAENDETVIDGCMTLRELLLQEGIAAGDEEMALFQELYTRGMRGTIEHRLGDIELKEMSLGAQFHLVTFAGVQTAERFGRMADVSRSLEGRSQYQFLEAFLATEFGDDLGESILKIAEKSRDNEQAFEIFQLISSIRQELQQWESVAWFAQSTSEYQGYFAGIKCAVEARVSQMLSPVPDIMDGIPQQADYFHRDNSLSNAAQIESVGEVVTGLKLLYLAIHKIAQAEGAPQGQRKVLTIEDCLVVATDVDGSAVRLTMRSRETQQAEARLRWSVEITPGEQLDIFGDYLELNKLDQPRSARLPLRLDLEKISGRISLDIGSSMQYSHSRREYPAQLLAQLVTAGVQHQLRTTGASTIHNDYHVRDVFASELSNPDTFAGFIEAAQDAYVEERTTLRLGEIAAATAYESTQPETVSDVVYTGLFFDESALAAVREKWPATLPNVPTNLHVTLRYRPHDGLSGFTPGEKTTVRILGIVDDGKAQALIIDKAGMTERVKNPHITLSTGNDANGHRVSPSYSKKTIIDATKVGDGITWFDRPIELPATAGYVDGQTGQIVQHMA